MPTHGFAAGWFGRRMRSLGRGGRRGGASLVLLLPFGGMAGWSWERREGRGLGGRHCGGRRWYLLFGL